MSSENILTIEQGRAAAQAAAMHTPAERAPAAIIRIESGRRRVRLELHELWAHRDLFFFLVWREIKIRYKQTVLGVGWALLQPILTMVVFTVLFGRFAHVPSDGKPYSIFVYAGLLPWNFFAAGAANSGSSLVGNANLITKVYFPRMIIPAAAVGAALIDFTIAILVLAAMMFYYRVGLSLNALMLPPLIVLLALVTAGVGMWMAALNVKYRDVRHALPFIISIWLYVTPVIYPVSMIPRAWRWLFELNPLSGIIQAFRAAIFGIPFNWNGLALDAAISVIVITYAVSAFRRMEREFADVI
jgi:lipopolysaccharide transport system permease protein